MDQERIDKYNQEISSWISKQGVFFQIFKAPRLLSSKADLGSYLLRIFLKFLLILLLVSSVIFYLLATAHKKPAFAEKINEKIKASLNAEEVSLKDVSGGLFSPVSIGKLSATGTNKSFFDEFEFRNLSIPLGNLVSKKERFYTSNVTCERLDLHTKISQSKNNSGESLLMPLLDNKSWFRFDNLEVQSFSCSWGYSEKTKGRISDTTLTLTKNPENTVATLKGGTFTYAWLKDVSIVSMTVIINDNKFQIVDATFDKGDAQFTLELNATDGDSSSISGKGVITNCKTQDVFKEGFQPLITGVINARYTFNGVLDSAKGLSYKFIPLMKESEVDGVGSEVVHENAFKLTHEIPVWRALTTLDSTVNYKAYKFDETDWELQIEGEQIFVKNARLENSLDKAVNLSLDFGISEPSNEYINKTLDMPKVSRVSLLQREGLREKAIQLLKMKGDIAVNGNPELDRDDYVKLLRSERHFNGEALLKIPAASFPGKAKLMNEFKAQSDGMRHIEIPLEGPIEQVTETKAQELYLLGREN